MPTYIHTHQSMVLGNCQKNWVNDPTTGKAPFCCTLHVINLSTPTNKLLFPHHSKHDYSNTKDDLVSQRSKTVPHLLLRAMLPWRPTPLAHLATLRLKKLCALPIDCIFSCIFSQTLGTPRKDVGRTSFNVSPREPCWKSTSIRK